jgi:molybdopterin-guanine dinucleotide biosynthesis protein A
LPWNLIVACDLPYLSAKWLSWLLSRSVVSRGVAVVPRTERGIEPLAAVYRRECGAPIVAALARGVRKVSEAVAELRVELVYPRGWRQIESSELVLKNMNAPSDYEEARRWWSANRLSESEQVKKTQLQPKRKRRSVPRPRK